MFCISWIPEIKFGFPKSEPKPDLNSLQVSKYRPEPDLNQLNPNFTFGQVGQCRFGFGLWPDPCCTLVDILLKLERNVLSFCFHVNNVLVRFTSGLSASGSY